MKNLKQNLYTISIAMIALLVHQLYLMISSLANLTPIPTADPLMHKIMTILPVIMAVGSGLCILLLGVLAVKGIAEAKAPTRSRFHISLAYAAGVLFTFSAIGSVINLFGAASLPAAILDLLASVIYLIVVYLYITRAQKLRSTVLA